jgi:hypothetical protein
MMSGANASPIGRSDQEMSGANASPIGRSDQEMSGASASPIGRSDQRTSITFHPAPRTRDVLLAQIRAVGFAPRGPALAAIAVVAVATVLITIESLNRGEVIAFHPERPMWPGMVGLLLPIVIWGGDERFGASFLWTLPVDRRRHALAKVLAGWVWLMGGVALFVLWSLALTLLSGGNILAEETLRVLKSFSFSASGTLDPAAMETVRWTPKPLLWLAPFTSATATYLLASAFELATRHPLRWIVGSVIGFFIVSGVGEAVWLGNALEGLLDSLVEGPYGFDALLTARTTSLNIEATLSTGDRVVVWRALPDVGQWATATLLWTGAGLLTLWAAASRHRESRRP